MTKQNAKPKRIFLSPPHMGGEEPKLVTEAFDSNFIAPTGPMVEAFEDEFCAKMGAKYALSMISGTAALHLALELVGVSPGDEVFTSTMTFIASASPIMYLGAGPVFIDSDRKTWNMDPELLTKELKKRAKQGNLPKAVVLVHIYGQCAEISPILEACNHYGVTLIEDAAEALGATYEGRTNGTFGKAGIYSFNGNKIITTSNGGMLVSEDEKLIKKARFLSQQARDEAPHYEHSQIGYNYRMSNILAAIGLGQLRVLDKRIEQKRKIFEYYQELIGDIPGIEFMPEASYGRCTRWLTCITVDPQKFGVDRETIRRALEVENIEARPVWKPMHMQPVFRSCEVVGGKVAEALFTDGLCLPSGTDLSKEDLERITATILNCRKPATFYYRPEDRA